MRLRVLALPVVALLATTSVAAAHTGPEPQMSFPQFERCLRDNGLTAVPDQQASMPVQVCKTVKVTRVTVHGWGLTIDPTPASPQIAPLQTVPVTYAFGATAAPTVSWIVDGIVVVRNMGADDATITGVQDLLRLPDGSTRAQTLGDEPFALMSPQSEECVEPPERVLRYSFTVQGPAVPQLPASGMNVATVSWQAGQPAAAPAAQPAARLQAVSGATPPGSESQSTTTAASVVFSEGRALNEAVYFRNANLTQSFDPAPAGIATGPPDNPGPFPLAVDQPPTLSRSMTVPITNTSLPCGSTATVTGVGVVQSPSVPELVGSPSLPALVPLPVNISSRSLVTVLSPACTPAGGTQPPVTGAGAAAPNVRPAGVPTKPGAPRATPCPRPKLSASLVGPARTLPNGRASWVITVRNRGRAAARQVVLREWLPPGFAFVGASRAVSSDGRVLRFSVRRLGAGKKLAIRLRLQAGATAAGGRQLLHVSAACGGVARAQARVRVAPLIAPAVTG